MDTPCLVLDEATAMLDPQGRSDLLAVLAELHKKGKTIISITHRLEEITPCDRAVVLLAGSVAWDGTIADLFLSNSSFRSWGLDIPPLVSLWADLRTRPGMEMPPLPSLNEMAEALCP